MAGEDRYRGGAQGDPRYLPPGDPGQRDGVEVQSLAPPRRAQPRPGRLAHQPDRLVHRIAAGIRYGVSEGNPDVIIAPTRDDHACIPMNAQPWGGLPLPSMRDHACRPLM